MQKKELFFYTFPQIFNIPLPPRVQLLASRVSVPTELRLGRGQHPTSEVCDGRKEPLVAGLLRHSLVAVFDFPQENAAKGW